MSDRARRFVYTCIPGVLVVAAGLRFYGLGDEDYWLDELHSLADSAARRQAFESLPHGTILHDAPRFTDLTVQSTWPAVWREMEFDTHPPAYFVLLLSWRRMFGDGEFAVRSLSALFSILSIIPVAFIIYEYRRPRLEASDRTPVMVALGLPKTARAEARGSVLSEEPAVAVACLLAVAFTHVLMAQEARPYSLGMLLVCVSYWSVVKMDVGWDGFGRRRRLLWGVVYGVSTYLALLTHYFTGLAILGQVFVVASRLPKSLSKKPGFRAPRRLKPAAQRIIGIGSNPFVCTWLAVVAAVASWFALTWGRQLYGQLDLILNQDWLLERQPDHILRTLLRFADLPIRLLFAHQRFELNYLRSFAGVIMLGGTLMILWRSRCTQAKVFIAWYLVPVTAFALVDVLAQKQLLSHVRYSSMAIPGLAGMIVLAIERLPRTVRWTAVAAMGLAVALTLKLPAASNPRSRRAAELIASRLQPGDLLIYDAIDWPPFWASRIYHTVSYYLPEYLTAAEPPFVLLREQASTRLQKEMADYEKIILVSPRVDDIPNPVPGRFHLVEQTGYVRGIGIIYLFRRLPGAE